MHLVPHIQFEEGDIQTVIDEYDDTTQAFVEQVQLLGHCWMAEDLDSMFLSNFICTIFAEDIGKVSSTTPRLDKI